MDTKKTLENLKEEINVTIFKKYSADEPAVFKALAEITAIIDAKIEELSGE